MRSEAQPDTARAARVPMPLVAVLWIPLTVGITSCNGPGSDAPPPPADLAAPSVCEPLDPQLSWYGDNRARLDALLKESGRCGASYDAAQKPVAIFDWDNTVVKNDVGDATFFYMLAHDKILQPPNKNWRKTSRYLTSDAAQALDAACGTLAAPGQPLPTATNAACAKEILGAYVDGKTSTGKAAWAGFDYRRMEPAYAWVAQLQAGYDRAAIATFTSAAMSENLKNPVDTKQMIGGVAVTNWIRIYPQIQDLITKMQKNGFEVWVLSASPQTMVEVWADKVGIAADHVIGIRNLEESGLYTYDLRGCGDVPDGMNDGMGNAVGNSIITYIDGKRCFVNQIIYGEKGPAALNENADAKKRPVFGAGDSDTDITFLRDATRLKLVLNRNKKELMCNAYGNAGNKWIVNPMFIQPRAQQMTPYPCATTACKDPAGNGVPCFDETGRPIADQADRVY